MTERVRYRDVFGVLRETELSIGDDMASPGHSLPARAVVDADGRTLIQKHVPWRDGQDDPRLYDQLDAEVRALCRLGQVFPGRNYPVEVARLVGYNVDIREPFLLLEMYRGEPVVDLLGEVDMLLEFQRSLLTGLLYLTHIQLVHGELTLDALRWDGHAVQIVDFEGSMPVGWPRRAGGRVPVRSPDQVAGRGASMLADDVWGAGIVVRQMELGRRNVGTDIDQDPAALQYLLGDAFDGDPARRPPVEEMLVRLGHETVLRPADRPAVDEGYHMYEQRRSDKLARLALGNRGKGSLRWPVRPAGPRRGGAGPATVTCPICMDTWPWPASDKIYLYSEVIAGYQLVDLAELRSDPVRYAFELGRGYRRCPNKHQDTREHYLPATYGEYRDPGPLVIGMVGPGRTGKTHLLTAMLSEVYFGKLAPYGLMVRPLDHIQHQEFQESYLDRFRHGGALRASERDISNYMDALLISSPQRPERPVIFCDVAGEDLTQLDPRNRGGRFVRGADALMFVHAPEDQRADAPPQPTENQAFTLTLGKIRTRPDFTAIPAAVVVAKSDRLRYVPPADRWMHIPYEVDLDPRRIREESRDVYAYLQSVGGASSLQPYDTFDRCTLHFVSASGGDVSESDGRYPRGTRPTRVLQPLVAILAMLGVITDPRAKEVGRP